MVALVILHVTLVFLVNCVLCLDTMTGGKRSQPPRGFKATGASNTYPCGTCNKSVVGAESSMACDICSK